MASKRKISECCPPTARAAREAHPLDGPEAELELSGLARALAHPVRVRILKLLAGRRTCVCGEIVDELPLAQSTVSEHLRILKDAGLIRGTVEGPRSCYCLEPARLELLKALVKSL